MKYLVASLSTFELLTEDMVDEEGNLKVAKTFNCETDAKLAARKLNLGVVLVPLIELGREDLDREEIERLNQRIQDQQREIENLSNQLDDLNDLRIKN